MKRNHISKVAVETCDGYGSPNEDTMAECRLPCPDGPAVEVVGVGMISMDGDSELNGGA